MHPRRAYKYGRIGASPQASDPLWSPCQGDESLTLTGSVNGLVKESLANMTIIKRKGYAYITWETRLLVFQHADFPEAGIQVPGGSLEDGEPADRGTLREAVEESGLDGLRLGAFLGERQYPGRDELHRRFFYHITCTAPPPLTWRGYEYTPSDGSPGPVAFDFYWVDILNADPGLSFEMDACLEELRAVLRAAEAHDRGR